MNALIDWCLRYPRTILSFLVLPSSLAPVTERLMDRISVRAPLMAQGALAHRARRVVQLRHQALVARGRRQAPVQPLVLMGKSTSPPVGR